MALPYLDLLEKVVTYIIENGGNYPSWFAGITSDPKERLFSELGVEEHKTPWIYLEAESHQDAKKAKQILKEKLGLIANDYSGNENSVYVFVFRKTPR